MGVNFLLGDIMSLKLIITSILFGFGLAMDAFSVSLTNGLNEPRMKTKRAVLISSVFAVFQGVMPLIGWVCIHTVLDYFKAFENCIPYIALVLLCFIGGKMLIEGIRSDTDNTKTKQLKFGLVLLQGVATSIDALSVGLDIADYKALQAVFSAIIIAALTFIICFTGVQIGKKFGTKLADKAQIMGGIILIAIGIEIFISGII